MWRTAALTLVAVLVGLPARAAAGPAGLQGVITDAAGLPIEGAHATLFDARQAVAGGAESGADGRFAIEGLMPGSYVLEAAKPQFATRRVAVKVEPGAPASVLVELSIAPAAAEVTVTAEAGSAETLERVPQRVNLIPRDVLAERAVTTLSEAASEEPGVAQQRTTAAMGAFFVRGLTGKNVAVYRDGVRYTTSAQRGGVSTFLNLQEPSGLEAIEVSRGPDAAQYGSDSLGGTVHLVSRAPVPGVHGEVSPFYFSPSHAFGAHTQVGYGGARLGLLGSLAGRRVNGARTGGGIDSHAAVTRFLGLPSTIFGERLPGTASTLYGGMLRGQYQVSPGHQLIGHYQREQQDGARRYDQLLGGDGNLIADLRNLMLDFAYLRYQFAGAGFTQGGVTASYNTQREERVNQGGQGDPAAAISHQYERVKARGLSFFGARQARRHTFAAGGDTYLERMAAPAFTVDPATGVSRPARGRVPHGARYLQYGFYVQDAWEPVSRLRVSGAMRYGGASYVSRASNSLLENGRPLFPDDRMRTGALAGRIGAVWTAAAFLRFQGQYSRGFRAPNLTDLGTLGMQGNGFFEAAAADLAGLGAVLGNSAGENAVSTGKAVAAVRPESSKNYEAGVQLRAWRVRAEWTGFQMDLDDAIVSQTLLLPPGAVGLMLGDQPVVRQLPGGAVFVPLAVNPVQVRGNAGAVRSAGVEHLFEARLGAGFELRESLTWIRAWDRATGLPPDIEGGTPPPVLHLALRYRRPTGRFWVEAYGTAADRQARLSALALADRRIGAARSRAAIASFFRNGARARGLVSPGADRLLSTGETLAQVQNRVLGSASPAPLYAAVPGYVVLGLRGGVRLDERSTLLLDAVNLLDRNYRGLGWGIDGPGRGITLRYRYQF